MSEPLSILLIEDDRRLSGLIAAYLSRSGLVIRTATEGRPALEQCQLKHPDAVILDLMLPDMNGIDVCRELRQFYSGPILILTASGNDVDQIVGLEIGADDYIIKPVEPRVLLARINAVLRRTSPDEGRTRTRVMQFGGLRIDDAAKSVELNEEPVHLTTHEFELLGLLASQAGKVLTRDSIYTALRGFGYDGSDRAVDVKISRLRKKLGDDANEPRRIKTIWGKGYLFVPSAWSP